MKYFRWFCLGISGVFAALVISYVVANAWDQDLDPAVTAILHAPYPQSNAGVRAFYFMLGQREGVEGTDAELKGRELWEKGNKLPPTERNAFFKNTSKYPWPSIPFTWLNKPLSEQWKTRPEVRKAFEEKGRKVVDQYIQLLEYGGYTPLRSNILFTSPEAPGVMIMYGSRWLGVYLGKLVTEGKWKEAEHLVRLEAEFQQSMWKGQTLLHTMIAAAILKGDARFLDGEKKLNPKLGIQKETLAALTLPPTEEIMREALRMEIRELASAEMMVTGAEMTELWGVEAPGFLKKTPVRWLLKPNETLNKYYEFGLEAASKRCDNDDCYETRRWSHPSFPLVYLENPMGRYLVFIFTISANGRMKSLDNTHKELSEIRERLSK